MWLWRLQNGAARLLSAFCPFQFQPRAECLPFLAGNQEEIDWILDEIAALKEALSHQNETMAGFMDPLGRRGHMCFMPSPSQV